MTLLRHSRRTLVAVPERGSRRDVRYHHTMLALRITLVAAMWVVGGCSASSSSGGPGGSLTPSSDQPTPESATPSAPGAIDLPASVIDPVVAEVAGLAGVPVDQVVVISAEAVTFPDGSLGCPMPGMVYTQAMVDGYKVVAEAAGTTYDFRGSGLGNFRRCEKAAGG
jgi:hypothetical protein